MHATEARILRERLQALQSAMDRAAPREPTAAARQLVQVYNAGNIPTQPDHFFACHPCEVDGAEAERGTYTPNCDTGTTLFVDFLRGAPNAGDLATAYGVGGRWVAEEKGGGCQTSFCVTGCNGTLAVSGASIVVKSGSTTVGSCTTDPSGCCKIAGLTSKTYTVTATAANGSTIFSGSKAITACQSYSFPYGCCVKVCLSGCTSAGVITPSGAVITIKANTSGATQTCTTDSTGCCQVNLPTPLESGGYTVKCQYAGQTATSTFTTCPNAGVNFVYGGYQVVGCLGCNSGSGIAGATVNVTLQDHTVLTQTTDATGFAYFLTGPTNGVSRVDVPAPTSRWQAWSSTTNPYLGGCLCTNVMQLVPASGFTCCPPGFFIACNDPVCNTLSLTDPVIGPVSLVFGFVPPGYAGAFPWGGSWNGIVHHSFPGACGCPAATVDIIYSWECGALSIIVGVSQNGGPCACVTSGHVQCPFDGSPAPSLALAPWVPQPSVSGDTCGPLDATFTAMAGCGCSICPALGLNQPCGCSNFQGVGYGAIWGSAGSNLLTWILTDGC